MSKKRTSGSTRFMFASKCSQQSHALKPVGLKSSTSFPQFYPLTLGTAGAFGIQAQVVAEQGWGVENFLGNRGDPISFVPDRWYCIEVFVQLTPEPVALLKNVLSHVTMNAFLFTTEMWERFS